MTDAGLLGKVVMGLLVVVVLVTAFTFSLEDLQGKYNFNVDEEFDSTYNYSDKLKNDVDNLKLELQGKTLLEQVGDLYTSAMALFSLPVHAIEYLGQILSGSLRYIGLPGDTANTIGDLLSAVLAFAILIAFVITILYAIKK